jgi:hypothetical protein
MIVPRGGRHVEPGRFGGRLLPTANRAPVRVRRLGAVAVANRPEAVTVL